MSKKELPNTGSTRKNSDMKINKPSYTGSGAFVSYKCWLVKSLTHLISRLSLYETVFLKKSIPCRDNGSPSNPERAVDSLALSIYLKRIRETMKTLIKEAWILERGEAPSQQKAPKSRCSTRMPVLPSQLESHIWTNSKARTSIQEGKLSKMQNWIRQQEMFRIL